MENGKAMIIHLLVKNNVVKKKLLKNLNLMNWLENLMLFRVMIAVT